MPYVRLTEDEKSNIDTKASATQSRFTPMSSSSTSESWGDNRDALAFLIPSQSIDRSDDNASSCWGDSQDALAGVVDPPSDPAADSSDIFWGSAEDALGCLVANSENLSENAGVDVDEMFHFIPAPPNVGDLDLPMFSANADHWLNSDAEEDPRFQSPMVGKSGSGPTSPLASTSYSDSQSHLDYKLSTDADCPICPLPIDNPNPRKQSSQEELFVGGQQAFRNLSFKG